MRRIWDFLGASAGDDDLKQAVISEMAHNPDAAWQEQKAKDIALPLQKGKQGGWREILTPFDRKIFEEIAADDSYLPGIIRWRSNNPMINSSSYSLVVCGEQSDQPAAVFISRISDSFLVDE